MKKHTPAELNTPQYHQPPKPPTSEGPGLGGHSRGPAHLKHASLPGMWRSPPELARAPLKYTALPGAPPHSGGTYKCQNRPALQATRPAGQQAETSRAQNSHRKCTTPADALTTPVKSPRPRASSAPQNPTPAPLCANSKGPSFQTCDYPQPADRDPA